MRRPGFFLARRLHSRLPRTGSDRVNFMLSTGNRFHQLLCRFGLYIGISIASGAASALLVSCSGPQDSGGSLDSPGVEAIAAQGWELIKMNAYNYADTQLDSFGHFITTPNACHQDAQGALDLSLWNGIAHLMNQALSKPLLSENNEVCIPRPDGSKLYGTVEVIVDPPAPSGRRGATIAMQPAPFPSFPWPFPSWLPDPFAPSSPTPTPTVTVSTTPTSNPTPTPTHSPGPSPSVSASPSPSPSGITKTLFENRGDQICSTIQDTKVAQALVQALDQVSAIANREDCPQAQ